ncbi:hypothetical protein [Rubrivirga sp.]|uniref:hypothetical protein n=1 Tax=Rubrivirga sp. TaxID=1885344 RepID=UPI003C770D68
MFRPGAAPSGFSLDGRLTSGLGADDIEGPVGGGVRSDQLGPVDVDGDVVVAGAGGAGAGESSRAGALVVFERGPAGWARVARLASQETDGGDALGGRAVAIEGGVAVTSSIVKRGPGVVYTFERSADGEWAEVDDLAEHDRPSGGVSNQAFGLSLDLDGGTLLVGAPYEDGERGAAYVYERQGDGWAR